MSIIIITNFFFFLWENCIAENYSISVYFSFVKVGCTIIVKNIFICAILENRLRDAYDIIHALLNRILLNKRSTNRIAILNYYNIIDRTFRIRARKKNHLRSPPPLSYDNFFFFTYHQLRSIEIL